ncbi:predicted protein [Histoplasma capsulatum H143]|uniref:Uncharacterized protein n=1 Tax=Ajellomyces capsulatus (strain H143) TaxID=544712 RepID=C6HSW5_AJECH|nr:predicted protein [Histoplasma capsulatum H143]
MFPKLPEELVLMADGQFLLESMSKAPASGVPECFKDKAAVLEAPYNEGPGKIRNWRLCLSDSSRKSMHTISSNGIRRQRYPNPVRLRRARVVAGKRPANGRCLGPTPVVSFPTATAASLSADLISILERSEAAQQEQ